MYRQREKVCIFVFRTIACDLYFCISRNERYVLPDFYTYHAELEAVAALWVGVGLLLRFAVRGNGFVVFINRNDGIVNYFRYVVENIQRNLRRHIEKFSVLTDAQVRESVDEFMDKLFHVVIFDRLYGRIYFEGQRYGRIVEFLGTCISTGRALLPIFTQSSRKLGFVKIYTYPVQVVFIADIVKIVLRFADEPQRFPVRIWGSIFQNIESLFVNRNHPQHRFRLLPEETWKRHCAVVSVRKYWQRGLGEVLLRHSVVSVPFR